MNEGHSVSVLIIDAKGIFRAGLCSLLHTIPQGRFTITPSDAPDFTSKTKGFVPDLLIADYLFVKDQINVLTHLQNTNTLVLFDPHRGDDIHTLKNEFTNFLNKACEESELLNAINHLRLNKGFQCETAIRILTTSRAQDKLAVLSERELEITMLMVKGHTTKSIADILNLSPHTIQSHRKNIMKKLDVHSVIELANLTKSKIDLD